MQQTMYSTKDPDRSLKFYAGVLVIRFLFTVALLSQLFNSILALKKNAPKAGSKPKSKGNTMMPEESITGTLAWGPKKVFGFDIDVALRQCKIVPQIIETSPKHIVQVLYEDETVVDFGVYLKPEEMMFQPKMIKWSDKGDNYYTLICADPDIPTRMDYSDNQYLYWLVVNINKTSWEAGDVIAPYLGPEPSLESGIHRVLYLVYKQPKLLQFNEPRLDEERLNSRRENFIIRNFTEKYKLGPPHAINFFLCENWDFKDDDDHPLAGPQDTLDWWNH